MKKLGNNGFIFFFAIKVGILKIIQKSIIRN